MKNCHIVSLLRRRGQFSEQKKRSGFTGQMRLHGGGIRRSSLPWSRINDIPPAFFED